MGMSIREAIEKMRCKERDCPHLDPKGCYSFCKVIFTDKFCKTVEKKDKEDFYNLAKKYGF